MVPLIKPSNEDGTYSVHDLAPHFEVKNFKTRLGKVSGRFLLIPIGVYARVSGIRHAFVQSMLSENELNSLTINKSTYIVVEADRWLDR